MKLFISAAEISSDLQAEACVRALIEKLKAEGKTVQVYGVGGPRLRSIPEFECIEQAESLRAMGFVEVLGKISLIKKTLQNLKEHLEKNPPDLLITFDYPDFHLRLLQSIHGNALFKTTLKVCAIPPKVWVWRQKRVEKIRALYDGVLVIFPFEKDFYQSYGIPVIYRGNPLAASLPFSMSRAEAHLKLGVQDDVAQGWMPIAVFPGSREGELKQHLPVIPQALEIASKRLGAKVLALVPVAPGSNLEMIRQSLTDSESVRFHITEGHSHECLRAASVGLIKSGTSTLESVLLDCFPVIFYRAHWISEAIFKVAVRYLGPVGLPNILLGVKDREKSIFPELLGPDANSENCAEALVKAVNGNHEAHSKELRQLLVPSEHVVKEIANALLEWCVHPPQGLMAVPRFRCYSVISFFWSLVNFVRRRVVYAFDLARPLALSPSILIGNLQAGGSGKTPVLIALARDSIEKGRRVAILTRGYGGHKSQTSTLIFPNQAAVSAEEFGDEVRELQKALPSAVIAVGRDRVKSSHILKQWAEEQGQKIHLVFLDDGFQNLKFKADYTVLCVTDLDTTQTVYRDFQSEAKYADVLLGTKGLPQSSMKVNWIPEVLPSLPIYLLCAVGNPIEVLNYYRSQGVQVKKWEFLKDHSSFDASRVKNLMNEAAIDGALLAVTEKDFVKLREMGFEEYADNISTLKKPESQKIAVLRRSADVKELFKRVLER